MRYLVSYEVDGKEDNLTVDAGDEEEAKERVRNLSEGDIEITSVCLW